LGQALIRANAAAALACTRPGSQRSAPQARETDDFLAPRG
jgi:sugar/nucleoside kinase (ribokinase family)